MDQSGKLHVAYLDDSGLGMPATANAGYVVYRSCASGCTTAANWSSALKVGRGYVPVGANNDGFDYVDPPGVSLAVAVNGDVHISFFSNSDGANKVWYAKVNGGVLKSSAPVTSSLGVTYSTWTAIAADGAGNPRIAFVGPGGVLGYARFDGVSWSTATADSGANVGYARPLASTPLEEAVGVRQLALALDATGYAHIAYFNLSTSSMTIATSTDGIHFSTQGINKQLTHNFAGVSLVLDGSGLSRAAYVDLEASPAQLYYSSETAAGVWTSTVPVPYNSVTAVGPFLSGAISLAGDGSPAIMYQGTIGGTTEGCLFEWKQGVSWSTKTADGSVGCPSESFALDGSANPLVAYSDASNNAATLGSFYYVAGSGFGLSNPMGGNAGGKVQAPDGFTTTAVSSAAITWSWTSHASNATGFRLFEAATSTGPFTLVADTNLIGSGATSWTQNGLSPQTTYFAYVAAVNAGGVVTSSGTTATTTVPLPPPSNVAVTAVYLSSFTVSYSTVASNNGYLAQASTASNFTGTVFSSSTPSLTLSQLSVLNLSTNTLYYLKVAALYTSATVYATPALSTATVIETPVSFAYAPISTSAITASVYSQSSTFSYLTAGISGINITTSAAYGAWQSTSTWQFSGLTPNTSYTFKAKARNQLGHETSEVTGSTYTLAAATAPVSLTPGGDNVAVTWSSGTSQGGYNGPGATFVVQASTNSDFNTMAASTSVSGVSAAISGLTAQTTYYFRVQAYNAVGASDFSWFVLGSTETLATVIGVTVDISTYDFQNVNLSSTSISTRAITVTNTGNVAESYFLSAATATAPSSPWTLALSSTQFNQAQASSSARLDLALLEGGFFTSVQPSSTTFEAYANAISTVSAAATSGAFTLDGSDTGSGVLPGAPTRSLWFKLFTPAATSDLCSPGCVQQKIQVTITAQGP